MDMIGKFEKYVRNLTKEDRICIYHHSDSDGLCSGVIAAIAIERMIGKKVGHIVAKHNKITITAPVLKKLRKNKVNKLVCTDLCVDQDVKTAKAAEKFAKVLVIDHHKVYANLDSDKTTFVKSFFMTDKYYPASKMVFDLFSKLVDISDLDWLAAAGTIADGAYRDWPDFINKIAAKHGYPITGDVLQSKFYFKVKVIDYAESLGKENECFKTLYATKNADDLEKKLSKYKIVEKEIKKWASLFDKKSEFHGDLAFYEFNPTYNIKSKVTNRICLKHGDKTLITLVPEGRYYAISARRMDRTYAVNDLLTEAVKGLDGATAGGHAPAAGGLILKKDLQKFKDNVLRIYQKNKTT